MATAAILSPGLQCGCSRSGHDIGDDDIAVRDRTWNHRIAVRPAGQKSTACQCRAGAVDAPFLRERAGLPVDTARDHDDVGFAGTQRRVSQTQLGHGAGREIFDHDVRPLNQRFDDFAAFGFLHVECDALFRAV